MTPIIYKMFPGPEFIPRLLHLSCIYEPLTCVALPQVKMEWATFVSVPRFFYNCTIRQGMTDHIGKPHKKTTKKLFIIHWLHHRNIRDESLLQKQVDDVFIIIHQKTSLFAHYSSTILQCAISLSTQFIGHILYILCERNLHCGASTQPWYFVEPFWHVPRAVWMILQLLCSPIIKLNFRKKTEQDITTEWTPQSV